MRRFFGKLTALVLIAVFAMQNLYALPARAADQWHHEQPEPCCDSPGGEAPAYTPSADHGEKDDCCGRGCHSCHCSACQLHPVIMEPTGGAMSSRARRVKAMASSDEALFAIDRAGIDQPPRLSLG